MIPVEAVEAAARQLWRRDHPTRFWDDAPENERATRLEDSHAALEAAAPYMIEGHFREINRKAITHELANPLQLSKERIAD